MAVLVQEQLAPEYSFVLHTASPLDRNPAVLYAELAVGLGETLASGTRGSPYRLLVNKATGEVLTLAFANFSEALMSQGPDKDSVSVGGTRSRRQEQSRGAPSGPVLCASLP
jgi:phosphoglucan, water dikinase